MATTPIESLSTEDVFDAFISKKRLNVVHFKSEWSQPCKEMRTILELLQTDNQTPDVIYGEVEAEDLPSISMKHNITSVPTVLLFSNGKEVGRVGGLRKAELENLIKSYISKSPNMAANAKPVTVTKHQDDKSPEDLQERLKNLVNKSQVMIFMKGNPNIPRCGFSKTLVGILNEAGVPYDTFDILEDEEVRQGLKTFANWLTYPMVFVKGELIGGLDIIKDLQKDGELMATLNGQS